jgi:hypothetical protein
VPDRPISGSGPFINVEGVRAFGGVRSHVLNQGIDANLMSPGAIRIETNKAAQEAVVSSEAVARYMGRAAKDAAQVAMLMSQAAREVSMERSSGSGVQGGGRDAAPGGPGSPPDSTHVPMQRRTRPTKPPMSVAPTSEHPQHRMLPFDPQDAVFTARPGERYTVEQLRKDVGSSMLRHLQSVEWGDQYVQDAKGNWYPKGADRRYKANRVDEEDHDFRRFMARQAIMGGARNLFGGMAEGQTVMGSARGALAGMGGAGAAAAKTLGYAAAAVALGQKAMDFSETQRSTNLGWQRILGGSNSEGFEERARSQWKELSGRFEGVSSGVSSELYHKAAEIYGTDRMRRNEAYEFGTEVYKKLGMTVEESMGLVATAAKSGNENLQVLSDTLKNLSQSARDAHVNAEAAQQSFARTFGVVSESVGGTSATQVSSVMEQMKTGMGRRFQDVDMSGALSGSALVMRAQVMGQTPSQYLTTLKGTGGARHFAQSTQLVAGNLAGAMLPAEAQAMIQERIKANGGVMKGEDWDRLAQDLSMGPLANLPPESIINAMSTHGLGAGYNQENALAGLLQMSYTDQTALADQVVEDAGGSISPAEQKRWGDTAKKQERDIARLTFHDPNLKARSLASKQFATTGVYSRLLDKISNQDYESKRRFRVDTADGPRDVTTEELLKYYSDQASTGEVEIVRGSGEGQTLSEYTGISGQSVATPSADEPAKAGKEPKESNKVQLQIIAEPVLRQYLQFLTVDQVAAQARSQGTTPAPSPRQMPTG